MSNQQVPGQLQSDAHLMIQPGVTMRRIVIEGDNRLFVMDPEGRIFDYQGQFIGSTDPFQIPNEDDEILFEDRTPPKKMEAKDMDMENHKDCVICFNLMIEPVCFERCGHRICVNCLKILIIKDDQRKCPMCRLEHRGHFQEKLSAVSIDTTFQNILLSKYQESFIQNWLNQCKQKKQPFQERQIIIEFEIGNQLKYDEKFNQFYSMFLKFHKDNKTNPKLIGSLIKQVALIDIKLQNKTIQIQPKAFDKQINYDFKKNIDPSQIQIQIKFFKKTGAVNQTKILMLEFENKVIKVAFDKKKLMAYLGMSPKKTKPIIRKWRILRRM